MRAGSRWSPCVPGDDRGTGTRSSSRRTDRFWENRPRARMTSSLTPAVVHRRFGRALLLALGLASCGGGGGTPAGGGGGPAGGLPPTSGGAPEAPGAFADLTAESGPAAGQ